MAFTICYHR